MGEVLSGQGVSIYQVVVGPIANNVYVVRCTETGSAVLIDAANEHERLLELCRSLGVERVLETHGHWDHIGAVEKVRESGFDVAISSGDAHLLPSYDSIIHDDDVITFGHQALRVLHTPGHTEGSLCFELIGHGLIFSGDTLFPGGPGATNFEGGDFPTIITSIESRLFRPFPSTTQILPGHGAWTTLGDEAPHLSEWISRGW
jgi:glyoxylase-like metal-dependent hydrolase (beta-lactamase superfamily II)